jgi:hypothetical protein
MFSSFVFLQAPDCGDFSALNAISNSCVKDTVKAVLAAWKPRSWSGKETIIKRS